MRLAFRIACFFARLRGQSTETQEEENLYVSITSEMAGRITRRASGALPGVGIGACANVRRSAGSMQIGCDAGIAYDLRVEPGSAQAGGATISDQGDVTVLVFGAATNTKYAVSFVSNDGTQTTAIGNLTTDKNGDGAFRKDAFFKFGTVGAGNVVLSSSGSEEFVTGISISSDGLESARDFQPGLVRCTDVTVPGTLSSCGSDPLTSGHVDVENDDGALSIHVSGARPSTSYTASLVSPGGTTTALGTLPKTDKHGNATLIEPTEFAASTIGSGSVVLQSGSTNEFVSGFKVDEKFVRPAVSASNLVECGAVTDPNDLVCGSDPLDEGSYEVNAGGQIIVKLKGAEPSTNYEVYFRPIDNSGDVDTGIEVPTGALGNATTGPKKNTSSRTRLPRARWC